MVDTAMRTVFLLMLAQCFVFQGANTATRPVIESPSSPRDHFALQFPTASQQDERRDGRGDVYKSRIVPTWSADGDRFWYRIELRGVRREYILVDAVKGERAPAFDHQRLAKALTDLGASDVDPERLDLASLNFDGNVMVFRTNRVDFKCNLETYELDPFELLDAAGDSGIAAMHPDDAPRASVRTGEETELRFINRTDADVELFWIDPRGQRRSYGVVEAGNEKPQHTFAGHVWLVVNNAGDAVVAFEAPERPADAVITGEEIERQTPRQRRGRRGARSPENNSESPDGNWRAEIREGNIFMRELLATGDGEFQLTADGTPEVAWGQLEWSPDSRTLVAFRIEPGERKEVFLIESSPPDGGRAVLHKHPYPLPGDRFASYEMTLFQLHGAESSPQPDAGDDTVQWQALKPDVERIDFGRPDLRWSDDGQSFWYTKVDRGHQRYRITEIDAHSGQSRTIIDEQSDTFIRTAYTGNLFVRQWLEQTGELIYVSEVDGWRHLYLIDSSIQPDSAANTNEPQIANGGKRLFAPGLKSQITRGEFVVRGVDLIDEEKRQIWFRASGRDRDQDPYFIHYYRVNFDGTGLVQLTAGNGNHAIEFSPDRRFLIDSWSRVDLPPVHELRRADDGSLICQLETADIGELQETGWKPPEVFVAKGRDGTTDIWGIICRPDDFDPDKKYPVIEDIYAGPQDSFVPKSFSAQRRFQSLTDLGFIVVKIDGMGTADRSKAFHDVCWHNLKDAGLPDRILWMQAAAEKYPEMDLSRVGIYGVSAGGQNAAGAVLFHGDFYHVAVAACGCHDNRMDKASWNEQWMGWPVGPHYGENSNIDNAHRLEGKLMLIVGELDRNVPPESTMRLADALIRANKDFELVVVPGAGHGMGGRYGSRRMHDFFVEHLLNGDDSPAISGSMAREE